MLLCIEYIRKNFFQVFFWIASSLVVGIFAYSLAIIPKITIGFSLFAVLVYVLFYFRRLSIFLVLILPVIGELLRLPFGSEGGFIISDVFIPLVIGIWLFRKLLNKSSWPKSVLFMPLLIFIVVAIFSLFQSLFFLEFREVLASSLYLFRFIAYALVYFFVLDTFTTEKYLKRVMFVFFSAAALLVFAGFIQLRIFPDLQKLQELGWDPHINRLVSTWLDPNFIGGFFAFIASILLGMALYIQRPVFKIGLFFIIFLFVLALFLTYSRSAYLALGIGVFIISTLKSRKFLFISILLFMIGMSFSPRAAQRVHDLVISVTSVLGNTADNPDPTARLRVQSWQETFALIQARPLLGYGYNTLRYIKLREGFVDTFSVHSASGSDSSFLTILVTTGVIGFLPFLFCYYKMLRLAFLCWRRQNLPSYVRGYGLGMIGGIFALVLHSFFVNSLLFPQILIFFWSGAAFMECFLRINGKKFSCYGVKSHVLL